MTLWSLLSLVLFEVVTASHLLVHFFALSGKKQCTSGTFSMPYSPTMIVVDHDRYFLEKIATKTIELKK